MELLKERIRKEGKILPGHIVKVDGFLNHRLDDLGLTCLKLKRNFAQIHCVYLLNPFSLSI